MEKLQISLGVRWFGSFRSTRFWIIIKWFHLRFEVEQLSGDVTRAYGGRRVIMVHQSANVVDEGGLLVINSCSIVLKYSHSLKTETLGRFCQSQPQKFKQPKPIKTIKRMKSLFSDSFTICDLWLLKTVLTKNFNMLTLCLKYWILITSCLYCHGGTVRYLTSQMVTSYVSVIHLFRLCNDTAHFHAAIISWLLLNEYLEMKFPMKDFVKPLHC